MFGLQPLKILFRLSSSSGLCKLLAVQTLSRVLCVTILAANDGPQSPFHHILPKCKLARDLKDAYDR